MKIIFMGTPDLSVGTLEALCDAGHEVALVVTQPDKPKGRGGKMQLTPVKEAAVRRDIPVYQPKKIREEECVEKLAQIKADVIVVIAFGQILPKEILDITPFGCINVHASLLPAYRGAAPIQWAILDGQKETGVTTMQMDEGLDTGDMLLKEVIPIEEKETGGSLFDKIAVAGAELCVRTLEGLKKGTIIPQKQGESTTEYARMLDKEMGNIDWNQRAVVIERFVRGLNPWPGAYTYRKGTQIKIWDAEVIEENTGQAPGTLTQIKKNSFLVQTKEGQLEIRSLQLQGKKRMDSGAFLRGNRLEAGEVFFSH